MLSTLSAEDFPADTTEFIAVEKVVTVDLQEISQNIEYPYLARKYEMEGVIYLKCLIGEHDNLEKIYVEKADHDYLIESAVESVKKVKSWESAEKDNKGIKCWLSIPIEFRLESPSFFSRMLSFLFGSTDKEKIKQLNAKAIYKEGDFIEDEQLALSSKKNVFIKESEINKIDKEEIHVEYLDLDRKPRVRDKLVEELLEGFSYAKIDSYEEISKIKVKVLINLKGYPLKVDVLKSNNKNIETPILDIIKEFKFKPFKKNGYSYYADLLFTITIDPES